MGFFIRKAFKAGPVRFNLSKGGIGLSAGVTGARIGVNRRGAYVYGGRHGLYYREQIKRFGSGKRTNRRAAGKGAEVRRQGSADGGATDLFVDTGTTYPSLYESFKPHPFPGLKENVRWFNSIPAWGLLIIPGMFAVIQNHWALWVLSILLPGVFVIGLIRDVIWKNRGKEMVEHITEKFENDPDNLNAGLIRDFHVKAPEMYTKRFMPDLYSVLLQIALEKPDDDHIRVFNHLEDKIPVSEKFMAQTKRALLSHHLDAVLEDHLMSEEEESGVRSLIKKLNLPEAFAAEELRYIELAASIRKEMEKPLTEIEASIPLVRGEVCYGEFKNARLLEERVLNRFQHNRVQYRELGYEIQLEGTLTLTDRRMVITGRGSREYRLNRMADVITDLETNVIELIITNRKNPVFMTHSASVLISSLLQKILQNHT
jgi:hypothetical protein